MLRTFLDRLYLFAGYLAGLFLIAIFVLMLALSMGRPLGLNIPAGDDFVAWCMAATAFLGLAHTFKSGELIRVGLLVERLRGRSRHVAELVALTIGTATTAYFAWHAAKMTYDSWRFNDVAQGVVAMPLWIPQVGFSGGLVVLAVAFADELVHVALGNKPRYEKPKAETREEILDRVEQGVM